MTDRIKQPRELGKAFSLHMITMDTDESTVVVEDSQGQKSSIDLAGTGKSSCGKSFREPGDLAAEHWVHSRPSSDGF